MIEIVADFPSNVVALKAKGRISAADYRETVVPAVKAVLERHQSIRLYYELGKEFDGIDSGAMLEDIEIGLAHLTRWERLAVVTDTAWIRRTIAAFAFLVHGKVRVFPVEKGAEARKWIAEHV